MGSFKLSITTLLQSKFEQTIRKMKVAAVLVMVMLGYAIAGEAPSDCFRQCSGFAEDWYDSDGNSNAAAVDIDLTDCGFSSTPYVSTSMSADTHNIMATGSGGGLRDLDESGFTVNVYKSTDSWTASGDNAISSGWVLSWTAVSYDC